MAGAGRRPFPTPDEIRAFIAESPHPVGKREIARAFAISGGDRVRLKAILRELAGEGTVERSRGRRLAPPSSLPAVAVIRVTRIDADGDALAVPANWDAEDDPPAIRLATAPRTPALAPGDRVLARLDRQADGSYAARPIRKLDRQQPARLVGVFRANPGGGGTVQPCDRRQRDPVAVTEIHRGGAADGELVVLELGGRADRLGAAPATVMERLGPANAPGAISTVAIAGAGIPTDFPPAALDQAAAAGPATPDGRSDLRALPLVTIDGADARDFDDAVWAEADPDPANPGGWHLMVAIADVAHYVPAESPLDREARRRGNSCYFPDRVVPMLPEALSNGLCSLRPGEDRACLAAELWIDAKGALRRQKIHRAIMRSAARLTYEQVQAAADGRPDDTTEPLQAPVIDPLYGAFRSLSAERERRGTLDLDLPERVFRLNDDGTVAEITVRARLDSHRLIEEMMILANVAAASALSDALAPCLYRVHPEPERTRLEALRETLAAMGFALARGAVITPRLFGGILAKAAGRPQAPLVNDLILRAQAQAIYSPENIGHFGLALPRYAHFTSPIRRYADLAVHRALIGLLRLGDDGSDAGRGDAVALLEELGQHLSFTERRAAAAEREAMDRYAAHYLAGQVGRTAQGRISGVTRFGCFVRLADSAADGLVPISTLPEDYYRLDPDGQALVGDRWGRVFRLGAPVKVRIVEAEPLTGSSVFALLDVEDGADIDGMPESRPAGRPHGGPAGRQRRRDAGRGGKRR